MKYFNRFKSFLLDNISYLFTSQYNVLNVLLYWNSANHFPEHMGFGKELIYMESDARSAALGVLASFCLITLLSNQKSYQPRIHDFVQSIRKAISPPEIMQEAGYNDPDHGDHSRPVLDNSWRWFLAALGATATKSNIPASSLFTIFFDIMKIFNLQKTVWLIFPIIIDIIADIGETFLQYAIQGENLSWRGRLSVEKWGRTLDFFVFMGNLATLALQKCFTGKY